MTPSNDSRRNFLRAAMVGAGSLAGIAAWASSGTRTANAQKVGGIPSQDLAGVRERAANFLLSSQFTEGYFGDPPTGQMPGFAGLAAYALKNSPLAETSAGQRALDRVAAYLVKRQNADGSIAIAAFGQQSVNTAVSILALHAIAPEKYATEIEKAKTYLAHCQLDETREYAYESPYYGCMGESKQTRGDADLNSTALGLEAFHEIKLDAGDPAYAKALTFLKRCQDHEETNDSAAMKGGDNSGAFVYRPGESAFGTYRSQSRKDCPKPYGSMTYQALKSLAYCAVDPSDPSLAAAFKWVRANYSVTEHPGANGNDGYFYYLMSMAKALRAWNVDSMQLANGQNVQWSSDLLGRLGELQGSDGSFRNNSGRWLEDNQVLCTSYALIAANMADQNA